MDEARRTFDPVYYSRRGSYWRNVPVTLPTEEMLRMALPEGTIAAGGSADGFVYFERLGAETQRMQLRVELLDANNGSRLGEAAMPFIVDTATR